MLKGEHRPAIRARGELHALVVIPDVVPLHAVATVALVRTHDADDLARVLEAQHGEMSGLEAQELVVLAEVVPLAELVAVVTSCAVQREDLAAVLEAQHTPAIRAKLKAHALVGLAHISPLDGCNRRGDRPINT